MPPPYVARDEEEVAHVAARPAVHRHLHGGSPHVRLRPGRGQHQGHDRGPAPGPQPRRHHVSGRTGRGRRMGVPSRVLHDGQGGRRNGSTHVPAQLCQHATGCRPPGCRRPRCRRGRRLRARHRRRAGLSRRPRYPDEERCRWDCVHEDCRGCDPGDGAWNTGAPERVVRPNCNLLNEED